MVRCTNAARLVRRSAVPTREEEGGWGVIIIVVNPVSTVGSEASYSTSLSHMKAERKKDLRSSTS